MTNNTLFCIFQQTEEPRFQSIPSLFVALYESTREDYLDFKAVKVNYLTLAVNQISIHSNYGLLNNYKYKRNNHFIRC
jgi:hypothetical protein